MATKEKIFKKKKKIVPEPESQIDNKDLDNEDTVSKDSIPVVVKSAEDNNIIDNVIKQDQETKPESLNEDKEIVKDDNQSDSTSVKSKDGFGENSKEEVGVKSKDGLGVRTKDGVGRYEKKEQDKERSRSPSVLSSASNRRSSSPFSRNVVEPAPDDGTVPGSNMGSQASLRSNFSAKSKEAWSDNNEPSTSKSRIKRPKSSTSTLVSKLNEKTKQDDTVSIRSKQSMATEQHQNAYIPYLYARNCIKQITTDMESMKLNHIRIVHDIEKNYKDIENETQTQFNMFVLCLRQQYAGNVKTVKQVIEVHRTELNNKETYWKDLLLSLSERNNKALKDKKVLLIKHKLEIDRLVKEKEKITTELTTMVDKSQASVVQVEKDCTEKMEKETELLKSSIEILEKQNQELRSKSEEDQSEIERLTVLLSVKPSAPIVASTVDRVQAERDGINEDKPPVVVTVAVGREEHDQIEAERNQITKERSEFLEERKKMEEERERFLEEKKAMIEDMGKLQEQIAAASKNSAELEIKYASLKTNVEDSLTLQRKYHILETQYLTISALLSANIETSKTAAQENEELTKSERDMMETEKQRLQTEIDDWEKIFTEKNNRPPTQDDKPGSAQELYTSLGEVDTMVESLQLKLETLDKVKTGTIPPPPHVDPVPMVITEPVIKTIEVMVPDPATLEAYKKSQEDIEELRKEISSLQDDKTVLNSQLSENHTDLLNCRTRITELEQQLIQFKQSTVNTTVPVTLSQSEPKEDLTELTNQLQDKSEECDKLRQENEEMRKDMKKMMKRYQKLEEKLNTTSGDSGVDSKLLNMVAMLVREIYNEVPTAGEKVDKQLKDIESDKNMDSNDRELKLQALTLIKTGVYKTDGVQPQDNKEIENQVTELEEKIIDLESENDILKTERDQNMEKILDLERQISDMKNQIALPALDQAESSSAALLEEKSAHESTQLELETLQKQLTDIKDEYEIEKDDLENKLNSLQNLSESEMKAKDEEIEELKKKCQILEKDRLANVPVDSAKEIQNLQATIILLETEKKNYKSSKTTLDNKITELEKRLQQLNQNIDTQKNKNKELETKMKSVRTEKDKTIKDLTNQLEKKQQQPPLGLERKQKTFVGKQTSEKSSQELKNIKEQFLASKRENTDLNNRIKQLESEIKKLSKSDVDTAAVDKQTKRHEKILKELEKKLEMEKNKNDKNQENIKTKEEEIKSLNKDNTMKSSEIQKLKEELEGLGLAAKEGVEAAVKVKSLEQDNKHLISENKILTENFNSERVLHKKYYNMVEDMKGKIRVYCRARPLSNSEKGRGNHSVLTSPDEYSINISTSRGLKEFQFDQIFMEDSSQEKVFEDTNNLIQSAVDGYNVCMFAYGQTGSGKTFTMIGDRNQQFPGIAPRAFQRIFELAEENKSKFEMKVSTYMLELYNERLIDLFAKSGSEDDRLDIKKDKKGMVVIQGSLIKKATNAKELFALFEEGSKNRHVASTKMNDESSRSHLVIGIVLESTNKATGQIITGKLSLVDLAGSERVGKTGANAEQLKEAMSINKSLSALGDVISALSSEQSFIPYRNNKLTMLMQDSLGGNAKTLMFVNISPADYNQDESVISLTYASRVKLITNDASKNSDNKEIARLKSIIQKLKHGEDVEEED